MDAHRCSNPLKVTLRNRLICLGNYRESAGQRRPVRYLRVSPRESSIAAAAHDIERAQQMIAGVTDLLRSIRESTQAEPVTYEYVVVDDNDAEEAD